MLYSYSWGSVASSSLVESWHEEINGEFAVLVHGRSFQSLWLVLNLSVMLLLHHTPLFSLWWLVLPAVWSVINVLNMGAMPEIVWLSSSLSRPKGPSRPLEAENFDPAERPIDP